MNNSTFATEYAKFFKDKMSHEQIDSKEGLFLVYAFEALEKVAQTDFNFFRSFLNHMGIEYYTEQEVRDWLAQDPFAEDNYDDEEE